MGRLTRLALAHPRITVTLILVQTLVLAAGIPRLETDVGYRAFLGPHHPSILRMDDFLGRFGGGLHMAAVWSCEETPSCRSAFDEPALEMAAAVSRELERSQQVLRVESPATAPILLASTLGILRRRLVEDGHPVSDRGGLALAALKDPLWVGRLVSADGRVGAIVVDVRSSSGAVATEVYAVLDRALAPYEAQGWIFHRVGGPVEFVVAGRELQSATRRMMPLMVGLVALVLVLSLRSLAATLATLATVGLSVVWSLGLMGWLGWPQNSISQALPPLLLVIGVCDGIHLVARFADRGAGEHGVSRTRREELLEEIAFSIGRACTMTSVTTAVGFVSFAASDLESFAHFGWIAAFGVMAALLLTFTLLPILLRYVSPERVPIRSASLRWDRALARLMDFDRRHASTIVVCTVLLGLAMTWGTATLRTDASFEELYGEKSQVVRWSHFVSSQLAEPDRLEIELVFPDSGSLAAPATLGTLEHVGQLTQRFSELGRWHSVLDLLAAVRRAAGLPAQDGRWKSSDGELNQRILDGLEEGGGGALGRWVDPSRHNLRVSVEASKAPQAEMRRVISGLESSLASDLPVGWKATLTGPFVLVHDMVDAIRATQLRSFATAAAGILVMLAIFLCSIRWALLALIPTLLPVALTLGVMGFLGIALDVGSSMVAAVILGLAVDDAIHMLHRMRQLGQGGASHAQAVHDAVLHVGRALATTSFALALGFAALALSPWQSIAHFGLLSAVAILVALAADLVVLPALMIRFGVRAEPRSSA